MDQDSLGQKSDIWDGWWNGINPVSEIQMWDFYGGRQWISKYIPRFGKTIEAGCGLGRYVFYFRRLGIDIEGIDFSDAVVEKLKIIKDKIEPSAVFQKGEVTSLPYEDSSLSGYISLGVIEHFIEGPQKALQEAYRVLRPGGIAIITTPNKSFLVLYRRLKRAIKNVVKKIIGREIVEHPFFQYEYTPSNLKTFLQKQGFYVSRYDTCDLLYPFCEIGGFTGENLKRGKFAYWFANTFENTFLKNIGAQSITISIKRAPLMYCFLSGKLAATPESLDKFDVPISKEYQDSKIASLFLKNRNVRFKKKYLINPDFLKQQQFNCDESGTIFLTDPIFETFGFCKNISPELLKKPEVNLDLCVNSLIPIWRERKPKNII